MSEYFELASLKDLIDVLRRIKPSRRAMAINFALDVVEDIEKINA